MVSAFAGAGLTVSSNNDLVEGCYIGTNTAGTAGLANGGDGIDVFGSGNTIGGTLAAARNVISGNVSYGIYLTGSSAASNLIEGNYIGTNAAATAALANAQASTSKAAPPPTRSAARSPARQT